jgi:hypothetical protein
MKQASNWFFLLLCNIHGKTMSGGTKHKSQMVDGPDIREGKIYADQSYGGGHCLLIVVNGKVNVQGRFNSRYNC